MKMLAPVILAIAAVGLVMYVLAKIIQSIFHPNR